jgi:glycosyltransferase involved in cell wall biosynthesis
VQWFKPERSPLAVRVDALLHGWPLDVARWRDERAVRAVCARVDEGCTVVAEHLRLASYRVAGRPWVASLQNVDSEWHRETRGVVSGWRRIEASAEDRAMRRYERRMLGERAATVVTVSQRDADLLGVPSVVVPNGCDLPPDPTPVPPTGTLLFVGSLAYGPNGDAVRWWMDAIWPLLPPGSPPLTVVGRGAEVLGLPTGTPGVDIVGEVEDVGPHLARARAVLIPLRQGSGTRLKLLEAMAWGRPVVSTSKGAEGIDVRDGRDLLIADDAQAFATATSRLVNDGALVARLTASGRQVAERHDWQMIAPAFADLVLGVR